MTSVRRSGRHAGKAPEYDFDGMPTDEFVSAWTATLLPKVLGVHKTPYKSWERVCHIVTVFDALCEGTAILALYPKLRNAMVPVMTKACADVVTLDLGDNLRIALMDAKRRLDLCMAYITKIPFYRV